MKARPALAVVFLTFGGSFAHAVDVVKPGDTITLEVPYQNEDTSTATARNAHIAVTFENVSPAELDAFLNVNQADSLLGPVDIPIGAAQTFKVKVAVRDGAPDGSFTVRLHPSVENDNLLLSPDPDDIDTSVSYRTSGCRFPDGGCA